MVLRPNPSIERAPKVLRILLTAPVERWTASHAPYPTTTADTLHRSARWYGSRARLSRRSEFARRGDGCAHTSVHAGPTGLQRQVRQRVLHAGTRRDMHERLRLRHGPERLPRSPWPGLLSALARRDLHARADLQHRSVGLHPRRKRCLLHTVPRRNVQLKAQGSNPSIRADVLQPPSLSGGRRPGRTLPT